MCVWCVCVCVYMRILFVSHIIEAPFEVSSKIHKIIVRYDIVINT